MATPSRGVAPPVPPAGAGAGTAAGATPAADTSHSRAADGPSGAGEGAGEEEWSKGLEAHVGDSVSEAGSDGGLTSVSRRVRNIEADVAALHSNMDDVKLGVMSMGQGMQAIAAMMQNMAAKMDAPAAGVESLTKLAGALSTAVRLPETTPDELVPLAVDLWKKLVTKEHVADAVEQKLGLMSVIAACTCEKPACAKAVRGLLLDTRPTGLEHAVAGGKAHPSNHGLHAVALELFALVIGGVGADAASAAIATAIEPLPDTLVMRACQSLRQHARATYDALSEDGSKARFRALCLEAVGPGVDASWFDLKGADLRGRDLTGADFTAADLTGADLAGATLDGCSLSFKTGAPLLQDGYIIGGSDPSRCLSLDAAACFVRRDGYSSDFDENGVLYFIGSGHGTREWSNPGSAGLVTVTASSWSHGDKNSVVGRTGAVTYTLKKAGSWIMVDLGRYAVRPRKYTLRHGRSNGDYRLQHWKLEGKADDEGTAGAGAGAGAGASAASGWGELDVRRDSPLPDSGYSTASFDVRRGGGTGEAGPFLRYLRITQTDKATSNTDFLFLSGFEVYGDVTMTR